MSQSIGDYLEKYCLVADAGIMLLPIPTMRKPNGNWSLFANLEPSETDDRPALLMCNTL